MGEGMEPMEQVSWARQRWRDWRSAVSLKLSAWLVLLWTAYGAFAFVRDELVPTKWQEPLRLNHLLPSLSPWTWLTVLVLLLLVLSIEGIHKVSAERRREQQRLQVLQAEHAAQVSALTVRKPVRLEHGPAIGVCFPDLPLKDSLFVLIAGHCINDDSEPASVELFFTIQMLREKEEQNVFDVSFSALPQPLDDFLREKLGVESKFNRIRQQPHFMNLQGRSSSDDGFWVFRISMMRQFLNSNSTGELETYITLRHRTSGHAPKQYFVSVDVKNLLSALEDKAASL
jgi:hypothetical protein